MTQPTPGDGLPARERGLAMAVIAGGLVVSALGGTFVNVALPTIAGELRVTPYEAIWVVSAFQVAVLASLLPLSNLGELVGFRRIYRIGLVLFLLGSVGCAIAPDLPSLTLARVLQGIGAAGFLSVNSALLRTIFPIGRLGAAIGINATIIAAAMASGPPLAAFLLDLAPWRYLFWALVVVVVPLLAGAMRFLPSSARSDTRFDARSAALCALGFGAAGGALNAMGRLDTSWITWVVLTVGVLAGVEFVRRQRAVALPILPLDLLRIPLFRGSILTSVSAFCAQTIALVSLPFLLQHELGHTIVETGWLLMPWPLAIMLVAPVAARLTGRLPAGPMGFVGLLCMALGLAAVAALPPDPAWPDVAWRVGLCGAGFGLFQSPNNFAILTSAPSSRAGGASGMLGTARLVGQSLGGMIAALAFALAARAARTEATPEFGEARIAMVVAAIVALIAAGFSLARGRRRSVP